MDNKIFEAAVGFFVITVAIGFFGYSMYSTGNGVSDSDYYSVNAKFDNIAGIKAGSDIMLSGVKIGVVEEVVLDKKTYSAIAKMKIKNDIQIPVDSSAKVTSEGFLGGKYLSIDVGGDEKFLEKDGYIAYTQSSISLEDLIGKFVSGGSTTPSKKSEPNKDYNYQ